MARVLAVQCASRVRHHERMRCQGRRAAVSQRQSVERGRWAPVEMALPAALYRAARAGHAAKRHRPERAVVRRAAIDPAGRDLDAPLDCRAHRSSAPDDWSTPPPPSPTRPP